MTVYIYPFDDNIIPSSIYCHPYTWETGYEYSGKQVEIKGSKYCLKPTFLVWFESLIVYPTTSRCCIPDNLNCEFHTQFIENERRCCRCYCIESTLASPPGLLLLISSYVCSCWLLIEIIFLRRPTLSVYCC